ncbi:helix-turn-helix transcriptional regulator [Kineosporia mesophila]|uniref:Helix-turn-helix transcriptional regulator n=1 Tax=Kineosporia mesophila TaxID=566012 RepID=A0ABP6ZWC0_9ACTN|nr:helix-turn-helix domain-containing protein [Kineosporia mesophila]
MGDVENTGARIRQCRRARGLSLDQASGLAGISKGYLSRLERGERSVDSRALLTTIAQALEVSVADLTGQPYAPREQTHADAHRGVQATRLALLDPDGPGRSEAEVAAIIDGLDQIMARCDLVDEARIVPSILRWTQQLAKETGSPEAHRRVAIAAYTAIFYARNMGEFDLAWMAAEKLRSAAEASNDPATLGLAAYGQAHALTPAGALRRAASVAQSGFEATALGESESLAARGSCLLVGAATNASLGNIDTARAQLDDAMSLAARVEEPTLVARHTSFSSWNVIMHRVAVEVESGNPAAALETARPLATHPVKQRERMSYLWVDMGRAFSRMDRHREAIDAFRRAERSAPLRVRLSPVVRDGVRDLLNQNHRRVSGAELRGLAERCGVLGEV